MRWVPTCILECALRSDAHTLPGTLARSCPNLQLLLLSIDTMGSVSEHGVCSHSEYKLIDGGARRRQHTDLVRYQYLSMHMIRAVCGCENQSFVSPCDGAKGLLLQFCCYAFRLIPMHP